MHYGNIQPNPLESKVWLSMNGRLKTYNKHTKQWGPSTNEQPDTPTEPEVPVNPWDNIEDGIYAVSADGNPINIEDADKQCIAVALIKNEHKIMIAKNDAHDEENDTFYWGVKLTMKIEGTISEKGLRYLPQPNGNYATNNYALRLSNDFTKWESDISACDFNGKSNTTLIMEAYTTQEVPIHDQDMCTVLNKFNTQSNYENAGKNDWYVPSCGQLAIIYLSITDINTALTKIGGTPFIENNYQTSSSCGSQLVWCVAFNDGSIHNNYTKFSKAAVRFIRDISRIS